MTSRDILHRRLNNQQIAATQFQKPQEIVSHLLAMQSQDFAMAKWAIGLRLPGATEADVEKAFNEGKILRTHLMRPTWHFVTPRDIRWLVELTAPRIRKVMAPYDAKLGLTPRILKQSIDILVKELEGGKHLGRVALRAALAKKKLPLEENRLSHILMHAELVCAICSGPRQGKQFTHALFDERAPKSRSLDRDEALAEIAKRYFATRGPATVQDFMWWSGLPAADAREAVASLPKKFAREIIGKREYIFIPGDIKVVNDLQSTFLLPDYDEYGIAYKDRDALFNPNEVRGPGRGGHTIFNHMLVVGGLIAGTWDRKFTANGVIVETTPFIQLTQKQQRSVKAAVEKYRSFWR